MKRATDNLVRAAQQAIQQEEERSLVLNRRMVGGIAQEINARCVLLTNLKLTIRAKISLYIEQVYVKNIMAVKLRKQFFGFTYRLMRESKK